MIRSKADAAYMSILAAGSKIALLADSPSDAELSTIRVEQGVGVSGIRGKRSSWDASHCGGFWASVGGEVVVFPKPKATVHQAHFLRDAGVLFVRGITQSAL